MGEVGKEESAGLGNPVGVEPIGRRGAKRRRR